MNMTPNYNDLHRWRASIGVGLIVLAFVIPWFVLREPFDLGLSKAEIRELTSLAQDHIHERQTLDVWLTLAAMIACPILFVVGLIFLIIGLKGWKEIQNYEDSLRERENKEIREVIPKQTPVQAEKDLVQDLDRIEHAQHTEHREFPGDLSKRQLRTDEKRFGTKLKTVFQNTYEVLESRQVRGQAVDFVMLAKSTGLPDYIIEVKFMGRPIDIEVATKIVREYRAIGRDYEREAGRTPVVHLFFVTVGVEILVEDRERAIRAAAHMDPPGEYDTELLMMVHTIERGVFNRAPLSRVRSMIVKVSRTGTSIHIS